MATGGGAPSISVVTVCFNDIAGLRVTIDSVLGQTWPHVDFVVVDGGSTDGSVDEIERHRARLRFVSERDAGIYDAMNKGLRMARGDYVIFMNAGDTFHALDTVARVADAIVSRETPPGLVYGAAALIAVNGEYVSTLQPLALTKSNLNMFATRTVCHQALFALRVGVPEYDTSLRLKAELDWYYRLLEMHGEDRRLRLSTVVCDYRLGGQGEQKWKRNEVERISVTRRHNNALMFLLLSPFFAVPLVFRAKAWLQGLAR